MFEAQIIGRLFKEGWTPLLYCIYCTVHVTKFLQNALLCFVILYSYHKIVPVCSTQQSTYTYTIAAVRATYIEGPPLGVTLPSAEVAAASGGFDPSQIMGASTGQL